MRTILALLPLLPMAMGCPSPPDNEIGAFPTEVANPEPGPEAEAPPTAEEGDAPAAAASSQPPHPPEPGEGVAEEMPGPPGFGKASGSKVAISGTVSFEGSPKGSLRLDFMQHQSNGGCILIETQNTKLGAWSQEIPAGYGEVFVAAWLDVAEDGTPIDDPAGSWPTLIKIGNDPISDIDIVLKADADPTDDSPCSAPRPGQMPPGPNEGDPMVTPPPQEEAPAAPEAPPSAEG